MNKELLINTAEEINAVRKIIELQNDLINFVPNEKNVDSGEIHFRYDQLSKALINIFEVNNDLINKLDVTSGELFEAVEKELFEFEGMEDQENGID